MTHVLRGQRSGRLALLLGLLVAVAVLALGSSGARTDSASAGCWAHANAPYYDNGTIKAWGYAECTGLNGGDVGWGAEGHLKRNGTVVDKDGCWHDNGPGRCHVTPAYPNSAGDQRWCHYVAGGREVWYSDQACESAGF